MDLLKLGSNSLVNIQQALATTGHNVSNANTEGYSRQRVNFAARQSEQFGFGSLGQGAFVSGIVRSSDAFMSAQVQNFSSSESRYRTYLDFSSRLDNLMADGNHSLNAAMQQFWSGVQGVSTNPAGTPERQVLLSTANELVSRFDAVAGSITALSDEIDNQLKSTISEINGLCNSIRQVNLQIVSASVANTAASPNDLLDQRDLLLTQLSEKVGISVVPQSDGSVNVFAGKGQGLVIGTEVSPLVLRTNPDNGNKLEVAFASTPNDFISQFLQGGELQGLFEFRDRNMTQTESRLGLLAMTLSTEFNAQHRKGLDLLSNQGGDFFADPAFTVVGNSSNQGTAAISVSVLDAKDIKASDYRAKYDGSVWHLTRMSDGTEVTGLGVLTLDGMDVDTSSGVPVAGDSFSFNPAREALAGFAVQLRDPRLIAAASMIKGGVQAGNSGSSKTDQLQVLDASLQPLSTPLTLTYDANALGAGLPGFVLGGAASGTLAYDPATEANGKRFTLAGLGIGFSVSGTPGANDVLTIANNTGAKSDNRNVLALAGLQSSKIVNGQQDTLQQFYSALVSDVGINQQQAEANHEVQTALLSQAREYRDSVSGVNLDEEAANMLRYQQAYQASAQMIKIAEQVFQTLMNSIGG